MVRFPVNVLPVMVTVAAALTATPPPPSYAVLSVKVVSVISTAVLLPLK